MVAVADVKELFKLSREQLDELFTNSPTGEIPNGKARGTALIAAGTVCTAEISECIRFFAWQGKVFDREKGQLKNRVTPLGVHAVSAKVYKNPSWHDDKECIVIDYSEMSLMARFIRDEIRLIAPQLYLGKVYWGKTPLPMHFALEFNLPPDGTQDEKNG